MSRAGEVADSLCDCCPGSCTAGRWETFHCNPDLSWDGDDVTQLESWGLIFEAVERCK